MSDLSNNSFIPKRGPANKRKRGAPSRPVYVFTILSYVLMFATLIASGGVYLYTNYVNQQLNDSVLALNTAINDFNETDMQRVLEFDLRLTQASERLYNSVSVASVFEALEAATIETVQISSLEMKRINDEKFVIEASIETDSFDSTIFQRGVFQRNLTISDVAISDVINVSREETLISEDGVSLSNSRLVNFKATLNVPLSSVPQVIDAGVGQPITITQPAIESISEIPETESQEVNQNNI